MSLVCFSFPSNTLDPPKNETPFNEQGTKDDTFTPVVELLRENFCIFNRNVKQNQQKKKLTKHYNYWDRFNQITNFSKLTFNNHLIWIKPNYKSVQFFQRAHDS